MSNQTSPTNLNAKLESSTESTTNHPRDETNSELPSVIQQDNESSFSQNLGYNSPMIEPQDESEDSTSRLKQTRDRLARQLRETENELIQQEINELQQSLERRHRRGSDHYAYLTYEDNHPKYDVPQAPPIEASISSVAVYGIPGKPGIPDIAL